MANPLPHIETDEQTWTRITEDIKTGNTDDLGLLAELMYAELGASRAENGRLRAELHDVSGRHPALAAG